MTNDLKYICDRKRFFSRVRVTVFIILRVLNCAHKEKNRLVDEFNTGKKNMVIYLFFLFFNSRNDRYRGHVNLLRTIAESRNDSGKQKNQTTQYKFIYFFL